MTESGEIGDLLRDARRAVNELDRLRAENERLRGFINRLDVSVMHPDMGGNHQAKVRANGQRLTPGEWAVVHDCRAADSGSSAGEGA